MKVLRRELGQDWKQALVERAWVIGLDTAEDDFEIACSFDERVSGGESEADAAWWVAADYDLLETIDAADPEPIVFSNWVNPDLTREARSMGR